jgi:hypothetical protein
MKGAAGPSFLLSERARSECARSIRAVKDSPATPLSEKGDGAENEKEDPVGHAQWETILARPQGKR